jgi:hypothetical protein
MPATIFSSPVIAASRFATNAHFEKGGCLLGGGFYPIQCIICLAFFNSLIFAAATALELVADKALSNLISSALIIIDRNLALI